ncbi:MAG: hypothetical protein RLZZ387_2650 [Chloroflexota bacterium]|jgi:hypothetical protein
MRLLILACSATKRHDVGLLPALDRYDGPSYRTLRRFLTHHPEKRDALAVLILSAEFGLIGDDTLVPDYDRRMDAARATELRPSIADALTAQLNGRHYGATFVSLGRDYAAALVITDEVRSWLGNLTVASGGIGTRLGQLRRWLVADR